MGFNYDPYQHIELIRADNHVGSYSSYRQGWIDFAQENDFEIPKEESIRKGFEIRKKSLQGWYWHCHNCGGDGALISVDLFLLVDDWEKHLTTSHSVNPIDFAGWSKY